MSILTVCSLVALAAGVLALGGWARRQQARIDALQARLHTVSGDHASREAVVAERERIYRDLHDDIGGRLLTLVHGSHDADVTAIAREVLQDLRSVVSRSHSAEGTLLETLAQVRDEMEQRVEAVGAELIWQQAPDIPDPDMAEANALHLYRIAREAVSNAIRHAQARRIRVRVSAAAGVLIMDFTDDGPGVAAERIGSSRGTTGMRQRAEELHGDIAWDPGTEGGTKVVLRVPLDPPPSGGYGAGAPAGRLEA